MKYTIRNSRYIESYNDIIDIVVYYAFYFMR